MRALLDVGIKAPCHGMLVGGALLFRLYLNG